MSKPTAKPPGDSCRTCANRAHSHWRLLSEAELERLERSRRELTREPGEAIFEQGEPATAAYCIKCGAVAMRRLDAEGNSVTLGLHYPGDLIGQHALLAVAEAHGYRRGHFAPELVRCRPFVADGLARIDGSRLTVRDEGRAALRVIAAQFDQHLAPEAGRRRHAVAV